MEQGAQELPQLADRPVDPIAQADAAMASNAQRDQVATQSELSNVYHDEMRRRGETHPDLMFARRSLEEAQAKLATAWFSSLPPASQRQVMDLVLAGNANAVKEMYNSQAQ